MTNLLEMLREKMLIYGAQWGYFFELESSGCSQNTVWVKFVGKIVKKVKKTYSFMQIYSILY